MGKQKCKCGRFKADGSSACMNSSMCNFGNCSVLGCIQPTLNDGDDPNATVYCRHHLFKRNNLGCYKMFQFYTEK